MGTGAASEEADGSEGPSAKSADAYDSDALVGKTPDSGSDEDAGDVVTPNPDSGSPGGCTTGVRECVAGTTPRVCVAGQWQYENACGGTSNVCLDGNCVACAPGAKKCDGSTPQKCSNAGFWEYQPTCGGNTPICSPSTGTCSACNAGDKKCDGLDSYACDAGGNWVLLQSCNLVCGPTTKTCGTCTPNATRCAATRAETCDSDGRWQDLGTCQDICVMPAGRLVVDYDAKTVTDTTTNLTWERFPKPDQMTYPQAVNYCANLSLDGGGWRLPTWVEVAGLKNRPNNENCTPAIDQIAFPSFQAQVAWTSTKGSPGYHWRVDFSSWEYAPNGSDGQTSDNGAALKVMCVR